MSPFLDDSPEETKAHILIGDFSFPSEFFPEEIASAQNFVSNLLVVDPNTRPQAQAALSSNWLTSVSMSKLVNWLFKKLKLN